MKSLGLGSGQPSRFSGPLAIKVHTPRLRAARTPTGQSQGVEWFSSPSTLHHNPGTVPHQGGKSCCGFHNDPSSAGLACAAEFYHPPSLPPAPPSTDPVGIPYDRPDFDAPFSSSNKAKDDHRPPASRSENSAGRNTVHLDGCELWASAGHPAPHGSKDIPRSRREGDKDKTQFASRVSPVSPPDPSLCTDSAHPPHWSPARVRPTLVHAMYRLLPGPRALLALLAATRVASQTVTPTPTQAASGPSLTAVSECHPHGSSL